MRVADKTVKPAGFAATYATLHLLRELIKRDLNARFAGSALGLAWTILQPLSLVALYWFVFTLIIPGRGFGLGPSYVYFLVAGLIPWLGVNEGLIRSTTAVVDNAAIVRRLPLRSELLVVVPNVSAVLFECVGLALFLVIALVRGGVSLRQLWVLPAALVLQLSLQIGVGLVLAAMYVFFRDLTQITGFVLSVIFYLTPILYPGGHRFETFLSWNPLTPLVGLFRSAVLASPLPEAGSLVYLLVAATAALTAGLLIFRKVQPTLVDLI